MKTYLASLGKREYKLPIHVCNYIAQAIIYLFK